MPALPMRAAAWTLCATGRTAFVKAVFDCLMLDACQAPSDTSGATDCVDAAIAANATANDRAFGATACSCEGSSPEPGCDIGLPAETLADTMMLNDSDVAELSSCIAAMGCAAATACLSASPFGPVIAACS